jgi:pimeloyl-ACP methyl ester carboxylesterase
MMISRKLFSAAILYLIGQWLAGLVRRRPLRVVTHADGEQDGPLVHRYIYIDRTLAGRPTSVTFHYVESVAREQECIVFLHGFMDSWRLWRRQLGAFADRYFVIAFDLKGTGQSSKNYPQALFPDVNDAGGDYRLEMQADELTTALDRIGVRRFHLVTLDLGTIIGDILAGLYPERILSYMRCQQPLVGHFQSSIRQGRILRKRRGARIFTAILERSPGALLRILYGRTGWGLLDRDMKRTKDPMPDHALREAIDEAAHPFSSGPRAGKPAAFACAWAGLYQHNQDYMQYLRDNLRAYSKYGFPVLLVQGMHDIAMLPSQFDGSTGMAFKTVGGNVPLSRPFYGDGKGLRDGYRPWAGLIPDCDRPLKAEEFFPKAPSVDLRFVDAGHFLPLEAPETFTDLLEKFLVTKALPYARLRSEPRP